MRHKVESRPGSAALAVPKVAAIPSTIGHGAVLRRYFSPDFFANPCPIRPGFDKPKLAMDGYRANRIAAWRLRGRGGIGLKAACAQPRGRCFRGMGKLFFQTVGLRHQRKIAAPPQG
ncbi:hypothetical protein GCM10019060_20290 [Novosphingobium pokkalii]|nr:hypothetical protein GCM10019060_20290 [Novosphingobium pokkalii]